jgi:hypothetical protein
VLAPRPVWPGREYAGGGDRHVGLREHADGADETDGLPVPAQPAAQVAGSLPPQAALAAAGAVLTVVSPT